MSASQGSVLFDFGASYFSPIFTGLICFNGIFYGAHP